MVRGRKTAVDETVEKAGDRPRGDSGAGPVWPVPEALTQSVVYCRIPTSTRMKLDTAILLRGDHRERLEEIAARFRLKEDYGIGLGALRTYARLLEETIRPVVTSLLLSGLMGCLPAEHRRQMTEGSHLMLLSRVAKLLSDGDQKLTVADMSRLGTMLKTTAEKRGRDGSRPADSENARERAEPREASGAEAESLAQVEQAVRILYGLEPEQKTPSRGVEDAATVGNSNAPASAQSTGKR